MKSNDHCSQVYNSLNKGSVWIGADPRWPEVADYEDPDRARYLCSLRMISEVEVMF